jgi:hypothetical protein
MNMHALLSAVDIRTFLEQGEFYYDPPIVKVSNGVLQRELSVFFYQEGLYRPLEDGRSIGFQLSRHHKIHARFPVDIGQLRKFYESTPLRQWHDLGGEQDELVFAIDFCNQQGEVAVPIWVHHDLRPIRDEIKTWRRKPSAPVSSKPLVFSYEFTMSPKMQYTERGESQESYSCCLIL